MASIDLTNLNLRAFLSSHHLVYRESGANISIRCLGLNCPYCDDSGYHLGVFKIEKNFSCWKCGAAGPFQKLTQTLLGIGDRELEAWIDSPPIPDNVSDHVRQIFQTNKVEREKIVERVILPASNPICPGTAIPKIVKNFLISREITKETCRKYKARYCIDPASRFYDRLIIPIYKDGKLYSYQGRDLTGESRAKYVSAHDIPIHETLYGMDNWKSDTGRMIIVEGVLDVWRLGDESVATFGTIISKTQIQIIAEKKPKEVILAWDSDAYWKAMKAAANIAYGARVLRLPDGEDPDSIGLRGVLALAGSS